MTQTIWIVAVTPPPTTGMTTVTASISRELSHLGQVRTCRVNRRAEITELQWKISKQLKLIWHTIAFCVSSGPRDVIYLTPDSGFGLIGTIFGVLIVKLARRRLIIHHHVFSYFRRATLLSRCLFRLTRLRAVHVVLGSEMEVAINSVYGTKYAVVCRSNAIGVAADITRARSRSLTTIGFLSNLTWSKGVGDFLQLVAAGDQEARTLRYVLAGPATDRDVQRAIEDALNEHGERLTWLGAVAGSQKQAFFDSIDLMLFPTRYANEAAPLTVYEALGQGVPVLARAIGCISSMVNGNAHFLVPPDEDFPASASQSLTRYQGDESAFVAFQRETYQLALAARKEQQELNWIEALSSSLKSM